MNCSVGFEMVLTASLPIRDLGSRNQIVLRASLVNTPNVPDKIQNKYELSNSEGKCRPMPLHSGRPLFDSMENLN